jgi:hypothetical protein
MLNISRRVLKWVVSTCVFIVVAMIAAVPNTIFTILLIPILIAAYFIAPNYGHWFASRLHRLAVIIALVLVVFSTSFNPILYPGVLSTIKVTGPLYSQYVNNSGYSKYYLCNPDVRGCGLGSSRTPEVRMEKFSPGAHLMLLRVRRDAGRLDVLVFTDGLHLYELLPGYGLKTRNAGVMSGGPLCDVVEWHFCQYYGIDRERKENIMREPFLSFVRRISEFERRVIAYFLPGAGFY